MVGQTQHIKNILESLRGKSIIDKIILGYDTIPDSSSLECLSNIGANSRLSNEDNRMIIEFQPNFMDYVSWGYCPIIDHILNRTENPLSIVICARDLFAKEHDTFQLKFQEDNMVFEGRKFIEDTMFLDLERYCKHNNIKYKII